MKALARPALTEVATELGCVVVDANILSACERTPCLHRGENIGEGFGVRSICFLFSFFFIVKKKKRKILFTRHFSPLPCKYMDTTRYSTERKVSYAVHTCSTSLHSK
jgi:hypothetical protein